ncbi:MAG: hypothetical protein ACR2KK_18090 [Acidimicrobiales bacterium]
MRRRIAVAVLVGVGLFAGGGAGAQTTTTSTTTSSSTTSTSTTSTSTTSSTVAPTTTSSTLANPCTGQVCTAEPPGVVLSTASTQIAADRGSYCWREPVGQLTGCVALAVAPGYKPPILVVTQGETVTVRFTMSVAMIPLGVSLARDGQLTPLAAANPTSFRVDLAPGIHEQLAINARWLQGEVPYHFRLDVRAAAQPATPVVTGGLTLTG